MTDTRESRPEPESEAVTSGRIDPDVLDLLEALWAAGIATLQSCSGHVRSDARDGSTYTEPALLWVAGEHHVAARLLAGAPGIEQAAVIWGRHDDGAVTEVRWCPYWDERYAVACGAIVDAFKLDQSWRWSATFARRATP